ncbi:DNA cytosine methyltransferase [Oceanicaulis sp.]|uniref:DNA cytosine methyltransferase n=1 Tax=Oceanicaulis sp. TaxID=1924941 RepID=UPI003D2D22EA
MRFGSVCSGIEAASQAWRPLGWSPAFFSEIEKFPSAVLAHHHPDVPNHGDMTQFQEWPDHAIDVLAGGTPCQSFSVAGLRKGLADPRGNLMLTYLAIAKRYRPRWVAWENVPGVLSSNEGRDFGTFLGALGQLGYGWAYRVLDAQHTRTRRFPFAVPQRRRRVFVVGYLGDWRSAAAVLFDAQSLRGDPAPRRETGKVAPTIPSRSSAGGGLGTDFDLDGGLTAVSGIPAVSPALKARDSKGPSSDGDGDGAPILPVAFDCKGTEVQTVTDGSHPPLRSMGHLNSHTNAGGHAAIAREMAVRRLTPIECERLMGFPDNHTRIPYRGKPAELCPDGPRYKALGNSWAVNCADWIAERIELVEAIDKALGRDAA